MTTQTIAHGEKPRLGPSGPLTDLPDHLWRQEAYWLTEAECRTIQAAWKLDTMILLAKAREIIEKINKGATHE